MLALYKESRSRGALTRGIGLPVVMRASVPWLHRFKYSTRIQLRACRLAVFVKLREHGLCIKHARLQPFWPELGELPS